MKKLQLLLFAGMIVISPAASSTTINSVNDIEVVGNDIWLAQDATIIKRDKTTGEQLKYVVDEENSDGLSSVRNIVVLDAGDVWFSCSRSGVGHYDGEGFDVTNLKVAGSKTVICQYVASDNDGTPWVACGLKGFYRLINLTANGQMVTIILEMRCMQLTSTPGWSLTRIIGCGGRLINV